MFNLQIPDVIAVAGALLILGLYLTVSGNARANRQAVDRIERKLDLVVKHLGIEGPAAEGIPSETLAEIDRCIWSERRIEAIKLYREATGASLVDARTWVDRRAASY